MSLPKIRGETHREDLFITDAVRTFIRLKHRAAMRQEEDAVFSQIVPKIESARNNAEHIDLAAFMEDAWSEMKKLTTDGY